MCFQIGEEAKAPEEVARPSMGFFYELGSFTQQRRQREHIERAKEVTYID